MKLSKKRRSELYNAIREPIVKARVDLKLNSDDDWRLAQLEMEIWDEVKRVFENRTTKLPKASNEIKKGKEQ